MRPDPVPPADPPARTAPRPPSGPASVGAGRRLAAGHLAATSVARPSRTSARRFLAVDLGAESGRAVLGTLVDGRLHVEEIHRFPNGTVEVRDGLYWDVLALWREILTALRTCAARGIALHSIGVDTWGVDFGLLDGAGELLGMPRGYRDARNGPAMRAALERTAPSHLYDLTGCQILPINTVFQLFALAREHPARLDAAADLLFVPDLFHYFLCGERRTERTIASTSQLYDPRRDTWADEVFAALDLPRRLMQPIVPPGTTLGELTPRLASATGLGPVPVVAVASHDTASAVAGVPAEGPAFAYLSSGTWSLLGVEAPAPVITARTRHANFTNEGGIAGTTRVLRNIMGLWLLQGCRRAWSRQGEGAPSYDDLLSLAEQAPPFGSLVDPDHPSFLNPPDMPAAIAAFCRATDQAAPERPGETVRCILESLALAYRHTLADLAAIAPHPIHRLHVVGGGARNHLLCRLTAAAAAVPVLAGPVEATAIGNLLVQAMAVGDAGSLADLRTVVRSSFPIATYDPEPDPRWDDADDRFLRLRHASPRAPA